MRITNRSHFSDIWTKRESAEETLYMKKKEHEKYDRPRIYSPAKGENITADMLDLIGSLLSGRSSSSRELTSTSSMPTCMIPSVSHMHAIE